MTREVAYEVSDLKVLESYNPTQVINNIRVNNYKITEIINKNSRGSRNKLIAELGLILLQIGKLYENNYKRVGPQDYMKLRGKGLQEYHSLLCKAIKIKEKIKTSICNYAIKIGDVSFVEAYEVLLKKIVNLDNKIKHRGATVIDESNMNQYLILKQMYEQHYARYNTFAFK